MPRESKPGKTVALGPAPHPGGRRGASARCSAPPGWVGWSRQGSAAVPRGTGLHCQHPSQHPCSPGALLSREGLLGRDRAPLGMARTPGEMLLPPIWMAGCSSVVLNCLADALVSQTCRWGWLAGIAQELCCQSCRRCAVLRVSLGMC